MANPSEQLVTIEVTPDSAGIETVVLSDLLGMRIEVTPDSAGIETKGRLPSFRSRWIEVTPDSAGIETRHFFATHLLSLIEVTPNSAGIETIAGYQPSCPNT